MTGRVILAMLAALLGVVAGLGALIGTATITERSPLFLLAGLLAFCVVYSLGLLLTTRGVSSLRKRRVRVALFCTGTALIVGVFTWTALLPMGDPHLPPSPVEGQRFWELPTGSRIAYVRVPAEGRAREAPIIFLHGGPGVPDMEGDARYFGRLARDGFDVYVYDQVGRGRSSRLDDPRGYTLKRDVSDLEEIRAKIDAERVILIGHSYGGTLAAAYAASHPQRVAKLVLSSPDDPSPAAGGASMLFRLSTREKLGVYSLLLPPRPMLAYTLLQVNSEAAHAFAGDAEMDARFDRVYNRTRPALHCRGACGSEAPRPRLLRSLLSPVGHQPSACRVPVSPRQAGLPCPTYKGALRLPLVVLRSGIPRSDARYPATLPGRLRAQRLPGRTGALHSRGAGVPARPTIARAPLRGQPSARGLRGATLSRGAIRPSMADFAAVSLREKVMAVGMAQLKEAGCSQVELVVVGAPAGGPQS